MTCHDTPSNNRPNLVGFLGAAPGQEKAEAPTGDSRERPRSGDLPTNIDPAE